VCPHPTGFLVYPFDVNCPNNYITFVDTHPGFIKIEARNTHSAENNKINQSQSRTKIYILE
jgi:hypothetical protein